MHCPKCGADLGPTVSKEFLIRLRGLVGDLTRRHDEVEVLADGIGLLIDEMIKELAGCCGRDPRASDMGPPVPATAQEPHDANAENRNSEPKVKWRPAGGIVVPFLDRELVLTSALHSLHSILTSDGHPRGEWIPCKEVASRLSELTGRSYSAGGRALTQVIYRFRDALAAAGFDRFFLRVDSKLGIRLGRRGREGPDAA